MLHTTSTTRPTTTTTITSEYWLFYVKDEASFYELQVDGYVKGDDGSVMYVHKAAYFPTYDVCMGLVHHK